jgi:hypothetical protein
MTYVMVPVPDDMVAEVRQFLRWGLAGPLLGDLDDDAAARFFASLDDEARRFLLVVADAALDSRVLPVAAAAAATGCSEREALGLMAELNTEVQHFGKLPLGLVSRELGEASEGSEDEPPYLFTMRADVAAIVVNASGRGVAPR